MVLTLVLFCPSGSHIRGVVGVWLRQRFWPSFTVPHLAGRTDVLPSSDRDVADVGGPDP